MKISKYLTKYGRIENNVYDWREILSNIPTNRTYTIAADVRDGKLVFGYCKNVSASVYKPVYRVKVSTKDDRRSLLDKARIIKGEIKVYQYNHSITLTDACKKYGSKNVTDKAFLYETQNPYNKRGSMYIYDADVIEYWMNKKKTT